MKIVPIFKLSLNKSIMNNYVFLLKIANKLESSFAVVVVGFIILLKSYNSLYGGEDKC